MPQRRIRTLTAPGGVLRSLTAAGTLTAVAVAATCEPASASVDLRYTPPPSARAWQPVAIEASLVPGASSGEAVAADVVVVDPDGSMRPIPMAVSRAVVFGEIPAALVTASALSYYIRVTMADGSTLTVPQGAPESLFTVQVLHGYGVEGRGEDGRRTAEDSGIGDGALWISPAAEILSPLPGAVTDTATPHVAAIFDPPLREPWDAIVLLDGRDLTHASTITSELFLLQPDEPLARGIHRVTFSAVTSSGPVEASWIFFVLERTGIEEDWDWTDVGATDTWAATQPLGLQSTDGALDLLDDQWYVSGRIEAGWAAVAAETTAVDTIDVFLPYREVDGPLVDIYLSAARGTGSVLITARRDPVYDQDLEWLVSASTERFEVELGQIFPSLSEYTLDWSAGHGARASARVGRSRTDVLGLRIAEVDTLEGFGIYSRFAAGGRETFDWSENLSTSVIYLAVFDREESLTEEQRLTDPLRNDVVAGIIRAQRGAFTTEAEFAHSTASGETEGSGVAFRGMVKLERDWHSWVSLEYSASEPGFYSAGSYLREPGEHVAQLDYAYRLTDRLSSSGWMSVGRSFDSGSALAEDAFEVKLYARVQMNWPDLSDGAGAYLIVRYDRAPYELYDYNYAYALLGGTWQRQDTRLAGSVSWAGARSSDDSDTWSVSGSLRHYLIGRKWSAGAGVTWTTGSGGETTDYSRLRASLDTTLRIGIADIAAEYWMIERDDRADPIQTYTERVLRISAGRDF